MSNNIEKVRKYNIVVKDNSDTTFLENYGYYRYKKIKTRFYKDSSMNLEFIDELYRFDIHINRILFKFLRPAERSLKKSLQSIVDNFLEEKETPTKEDFQPFLNNLISIIETTDMTTDKKNKIIRNISQIIIQLKFVPKNTTIRRMIDEMNLGKVIWIINACMKCDQTFMPKTQSIIFGDNNIPFLLLNDIRNAIMHFNVAFENQKLRSKTYNYILESFETLLTAITQDNGYIGDDPEKIRKNFRRDIIEKFKKIKTEEVKRFVS